MMESINKLIEKVGSVTGIFYPIASTIKAIVDNRNELIYLQGEYDREFKKKIIDMEGISDFTKASLISKINNSTIEFYNQVKILGVAIDNMSITSDPDKLDDDWLFYFISKAAYITNEQMQNTWGKILVEACDNSGICTKTLLNTLSLMNKQQAELFENICKFRFANMNIPANEITRISIYPIIFFSKGAQSYASHKLTNRGILELEHLGLIDVDSNKEFVVYTDLLKLRDRKHCIEVISDNGKIEIGNIAFTYDGFLLQKIIENDYNSKIAQFNMQIWRHKGYQIYRDGKKQ